MSIPKVDVTSSAFKAEAYAYYAMLRARAPVHTVKLPGRQTVWLVSRYDDVLSLLKDPRPVKDPHNAKGSKPFSLLPGTLVCMQALERNMLDVDPPDHTRLRGLVHLAFTPRLIDRMRGRVEDLADRPPRPPLRPGTSDACGAPGKPKRCGSP